MPGPFTVDASIFLSAFSPQEAGHAASRRFLATLQDRVSPMVEPALLLPELAGAISRRWQDADLARRFASAIGRLPHLHLIPLEQRLARQAAALAAQHRLRGSDAVYAAVARQFGATLVTLDEEQRSRLLRFLPARRPEDAG